MHGINGAKLIASSQMQAIDKIEEIIKKENIDCDFSRVSGYLFLSEEDKTKNPDLLDEEFKASEEAGLPVRMVKSAPINDYITGAAIEYKNQGQFDPLKFTYALSKIITERGGEIYTKTHAIEFNGGDNANVKTKQGFKVYCNHIAVCTNTPVNDTFSIHNFQEPMRSYVIAAKVPKGYVPQALFWDTDSPYHYVRLEYLEDQVQDYNILIVGGEDHRTGKQHNDNEYIEERYQNLESWARERFPKMGEIVKKWSGQVQEPVDGVPFMGRNPLDYNNVYVITGDSGQGMTNCTSGAMLITDLIQGRSNEWETLFNPKRIPIHAPKDLIKHSVDTFLEYKEWLTRSDVRDVEDILPDHGAVMRRDGFTKVACYRDCDGCLHEMSAVCPHLGGIVQWNDSEKTFDCGCHGSRFDKYGKVVNGPANSDLTPLNDNAKRVRENEGKVEIHAKSQPSGAASEVF
jgi:glycine/D-amino acid oxidase-like deaminating enzyme/nitrite reductase/ring-hydroxylating ferredoxin subunit